MTSFAAKGDALQGNGLTMFIVEFSISANVVARKIRSCRTGTTAYGQTESYATRCGWKENNRSSRTKCHSLFRQPAVRLIATVTSEAVKFCMSVRSGRR